MTYHKKLRKHSFCGLILTAVSGLKTSYDVTGEPSDVIPLRRCKPASMPNRLGETCVYIEC